MREGMPLNGLALYAEGRKARTAVLPKQMSQLVLMCRAQTSVICSVATRQSRFASFYCQTASLRHHGCADMTPSLLLGYQDGLGYSALIIVGVKTFGGPKILTYIGRVSISYNYSEQTAST